MDLAGLWAAAEADEGLRRSFPRADLDDSGWELAHVPGHWRSEPAFAASEGPVLLRRRFEAEAPPVPSRAWLVFDGVFYQSDVWLDGSYLGDTEGYFFPHEFEVTEALRGRSEHVLAVEVSCESGGRAGAASALLGPWHPAPRPGHGRQPSGGCASGAYNPGGIWAPVRLVTTGPVRARSVRLACVEAGPKRAVMEVSALLDSSAALTCTLTVEVRPSAGDEPIAAMVMEHPLALGRNRARWSVEIPAPQLWWPAELGPSPLYDVAFRVEVGGITSDARVARTGFRRVRMNGLCCTVNGEPVFLKGAELAPTRIDIGRASPHEARRDVEVALGAGLNVLRARCHVARPEVYDAADELGMLIWQDLPLCDGDKGPRRQVVRQAGKAVSLLGHHPCVAMWSSHDKVDGLGGAAESQGFSRLTRLARHAVPDIGLSLLSSGARRAFERADPSRPVLTGSGALTRYVVASRRVYPGWYRGSATSLAQAARVWPASVRLVCGLGAQSVPFSDDFIGKGNWPDLDWPELSARYGLEKEVFDRRAPPGGHRTYEEWADATQSYQAELLRSHVELLRRLRGRPVAGFVVSRLNDAGPAVSWALLDHERRPKPAFAALARACEPVIVTAGLRMPSGGGPSRAYLELHVVNDLRRALKGAVLEVRLCWPGGGRYWRLEGDVKALACTFVGRVAVGQLPQVVQATSGRLGPATLALQLSWAGGNEPVTNFYDSLAFTGKFLPGKQPPRGLRAW